MRCETDDQEITGKEKRKKKERDKRTKKDKMANQVIFSPFFFRFHIYLFGGRVRTGADVALLDVAGGGELARVLPVGLVAVGSGAGDLRAAVRPGSREVLARVLLVGLVAVASGTCRADSHGGWLRKGSGMQENKEVAFLIGIDVVHHPVPDWRNPQKVQSDWLK